MLLRDIFMTIPSLIPSAMPVRAEQPPMVNPFQVASQTETGSQNLRQLYAQNNIDTDRPTFAAAPAPEPEPEPVQPVPQPEPTQPEPVEPDPVAPEPPVTSPGPVDLDPVSNQISAVAGRVTTLTLDNPEQIDSVRILSGPDYGYLSVDGTRGLSLVLSEHPDRMADLDIEYEVTFANGQSQVVSTQIDVVAAGDFEGWGLGNFYMLEQDSAGQLVVEHGDNHRKIHVTAGDHGLTAADIARMEGLETGQINTAWLRDNPEYGATPDMALSTDLGMSLWYSTTEQNLDPTSNWLLLERGYNYDDLGRVINRGANGESALHPLYVGAFGEGAKPNLTGRVEIFQNDSSHIVFQNLEISGGFGTLELRDNLLLSDMKFSSELTVQNAKGATIQNSDFLDIIRDSPVNSGGVWDQNANRISGIYAANSDGVLIRDNVFDQIGWQEGYDYNQSASSPMPPSMFSHNIYVQHSSSDVTLSSNVLMNGASFGAQMRPGGVIEGNAFINNNAGLNYLDGMNYTLLLDNLVTSAGHKAVANNQGARSYGIDNQATQSSLIGNIVAHLADPNNPAEKAAKSANELSLSRKEGNFFNDTIIYKWATTERGLTNQPNQNIDGLSTDVLDQTTIQNLAAQLLGRNDATIADLAEYLRGQASGQLDRVVDADFITAFFREGFGLATETRMAAETVRFTPSELGEGMRWDNRLNWSTEDVAGSRLGDSVDLGGNRVLFSDRTVTIDDFIFGDNGSLKVTGGRLNIDGDLSVSSNNALLIDNAGQVWINGYRDSDVLDVTVEGGRFANTGAIAGPLQLSLKDDGQVILATSGGSIDMAEGSNLSIESTRGKIGFDGATDDTAVLRMNDGAVLSFVASQEGLGMLSEFRSGALGEASMVTSGIRLGGTLAIDLNDWNGSQKAVTKTLIDVDQLVGTFDQVDIEGLGNRQDALIRIDYVRDEVSLVLGEQGRGTGDVRVVSSGDAAFIDYSDDAALARLWDSLYATPDDPLQ